MQDRTRIYSDTIRLAGNSAVRYGSVVSKLPTNVFLDPYLSLNRAEVLIQLPPLDFEKIEKTDAIEGLEEIPWVLPEESFVVVDDLDPGFQVLEGEQGKGLRIAIRKNNNQETDQGLPIRQFAFNIPSSWSRITMPMSWGKYRHTIATVKAGKGEKKAAFTTIIPEAGQWRLELYIPPKQFVYPNREWGTWHLTVKDSNGDEQDVKFDADAASEGWSFAENLGLPEGETSVTLSNDTDGKFVIADAIRWVPSAGN